MRVVELFAGVGGFRLGLERAGHKVIWANEFDKYAAQTYNKNFGKEGELIDERDITTIESDEIPEHDILVGGFPCQAFSIAGRRLGFDEARGTLFFECARILRDKRPRYFIFENVKGLLNHDGGKTFAEILAVCAELRYELQWCVLDSKKFGVPQNRERIIIVGHTREITRPEVFSSEGNNGEDIETDQPIDKVLLDVAYPSRQPRMYKKYAPTVRDYGGGGNKMPMVVDYKWLSSKTRRGLVKYGYTGTLDHDAKIAVVEGNEMRKITPVECERLQGFPDNWTQGVSDRQRYKQMGNAVTVNVIEHIGRGLK